MPTMNIWRVIRSLNYKTICALALPLCIVVGLAGTSLVLAIIQSLGHAPIYGVSEFPTLKYYKVLFMSEQMKDALFFTLYYAFTATLLGMIISVKCAMVLRKKIAHKKIVSYIYKFPLMVPYLVAVSLFILIFSKGGMLPRALHFLGIIASQDQFPQFLYNNFGFGIIMVFMWKQIPFMTLSVLSVLLGIGSASEEVARTLGANRYYIFFKILLPQLLPGIVSSSLICCAYNLGAFEVPFLLGSSYPGTLSILAWRYFNDSNYSMRPYGMVIVVCLTFISAVFIYLYLYTYRLYEKKIGRV